MSLLIEQGLEGGKVTLDPTFNASVSNPHPRDSPRTSPLPRTSVYMLDFQRMFNILLGNLPGLPCSSVREEDPRGEGQSDIKRGFWSRPYCRLLAMPQMLTFAPHGAGGGERGGVPLPPHQSRKDSGTPLLSALSFSPRNRVSSP